MGVICNRTLSSNSSQSTHPTGRVLGKNYLSFLDFTRNYERTSGILSPAISVESFGSQTSETSALIGESSMFAKVISQHEKSQLENS